MCVGRGMIDAETLSATLLEHPGRRRLLAALMELRTAVQALRAVVDTLRPDDPHAATRATAAAALLLLSAERDRVAALLHRP